MTGLSPVSPSLAGQPIPPQGAHAPPSAAEVARAAAILEAAAQHAAELSAALADASAAQKLADHVTHQLLADKKAQLSEDVIHFDEAAMQAAAQGLRDAEAAVSAHLRKGGPGLDISV